MKSAQPAIALAPAARASDAGYGIRTGGAGDDAETPGSRQPLLQPGRNCWRIERTGRCAFLVDGADYFLALRAAVRHARHSVLLLGWDIDSRILLAPGGAGDGLPETLGDFLNAVVSRRRGLHAHLLCWDFAMLFALDREWLPVYKFNWRTHRRLHFRLDGEHPVGASHHQKIVVVDDRVAFVGGIDLTAGRWDTPAHAPGDPRRTDPGGNRYGPFHDVTMVVDGDAARALGDLVRERWHHAAGRGLSAPRAPVADPGDAERSDPWPTSVQPAITDVRVGIARTEPEYDGRDAVQEIRRLYGDAIASARRGIYLENQYFTAASVAEALRRRLEEEDAPDIVLVSRQTNSGWLEETTMGVLRARLHRLMREADRHGRYRAYYPQQPGLGRDCINVHSKLMIVDDEFLTLGSANLSNRSMGFDTECNLALEAGGEERVRRAIAGLRHRLLGEHLGIAPGDVAEAERRVGRLLPTIDALRREHGRTLDELVPELDPEIDALVPEAALIDPERPIDAERFVMGRVGPANADGRRSLRLAALVSVLVAAAALAAAWRWTSLNEWLDIASLIHAARALSARPAAPLLVIAGFVLAGLLVIPVTALSLATVVVFGPVPGFVYAMAGSLASAWSTYAIGSALGRDTVRRLAGSRLNRLSRRLGDRGVLTVVAVRMLPIAPFTIVNMVAGASHIRQRDFLLGTLIGLAPGLLMLALFVDGLLSALLDPGVGTFAAVAAIALVATSGVYLLRRWAARSSAPAGPGDEH